MKNLINSKNVLADRAYNSKDRIIRKLEENNVNIIIPDKKNSLKMRFYDRNLYKIRHRIENFFLKLKRYRGIATRYDKTKENFLGAIHLICDLVELMTGST
jgi:transposase